MPRPLSGWGMMIYLQDMPEIDALNNGTRPERSGLSHQAIEDYLKSIYTLAQTESPVSTSRLAIDRDVKPGSVTGMIKRLADLNLVEYKKYAGVSLTPSGEKIALEVLRHHRLIETFLMEALDFTWDEVHEQADILEHYISEKLEERIAEKLDYPEFDPHGAPIPTKDGVMPYIKTIPLTQFSAGETSIISRIMADEDGDMLRYLAERGLRPGHAITVLDKEPYNGPIRVRVNDLDQEQIVGHQIAKRVRLLPTSDDLKDV